MSRPRSRAATLWVSPPIEMTSTPVPAMPATVARLTLPLASTRARPPTSATPAASSARLKLSSMMVSTPAASTGPICSMLSTSTSKCVVCPSRALASRSTAVSFDGSPPVRTARWLSLASTASERPKRWLAPPPQRTAYRSSTRSPGVVLRVSVMRAPVPSTRATNSAVFVAMALIRWTRFRATRSASSTARAFPETLASAVPAAKAAPSATRSSTAASGSVSFIAAANTSPPLSTPGTRAARTAVARASAGISVCEVMSPYGASSSRAARSTASTAAAGRVPASAAVTDGGAGRAVATVVARVAVGAATGAVMRKSFVSDGTRRHAGGRARRPAGLSGRGLQGGPAPRAGRALRAGGVIASAR